MEEIDTLFGELVEQRREKTFYEKIVDDAEEEFNGFSKEQQSRQEERAQIKEEIKELRKKLKTLKNVRNIRRRNVNQIKSQKRKEIKKKIGQLQVRLQEIDEEEQPGGI